jgi:cbb3-type cytochrome oxidase subunit 3
MWAVIIGTAFVAGIMGASAVIVGGIWWLYRKLNKTGWF